MALVNFESEGMVIQIDESELDQDGRHPYLHLDAKRLDSEVPLSEVPEPVEETVTSEPAEDEVVTTPADADPAPVEESHPVKRGRRTANKAAAPEADK